MYSPSDCAGELFDGGGDESGVYVKSGSDGIARERLRFECGLWVDEGTPVTQEAPGDGATPGSDVGALDKKISEAVDGVDEVATVESATFVQRPLPIGLPQRRYDGPEHIVGPCAEPQLRFGTGEAHLADPQRTPSYSRSSRRGVRGAKCGGSSTFAGYLHTRNDTLSRNGHFLPQLSWGPIKQQLTHKPSAFLRSPTRPGMLGAIHNCNQAPLTPPALSTVPLKHRRVR
ncbi:hypothetical protein BC830DRAFT_450718 [Chytriomyces sp. MP71]|nr:hypothetical protein BC830DRAFT_450718 [Chytriomyces sp. MP71]